MVVSGGRALGKELTRLIVSVCQAHKTEAATAVRQPYLGCATRKSVLSIQIVGTCTLYRVYVSHKVCVCSV